MKDKYIRNTALFGHFIAAIIMNTLAPLLPVFQRELGLTISESGILPTLLTVSLMVSNLLMGIVIAHFGHKRILIYGLFLVIIGSIVAFFTTNFVFVAIAYVLIGLSGGALYTSLATIFAGLDPKYQNFGIYHASWGIGGMVSPLLVTLWINLKRDFHEIYLVHIFLILVLFVILITNKDLENQKFSNFKFRKMFTVLTKPLILLGIISAALYSATEVGSCTWSLNMSTDGYGLSQVNGGYILSGFWFLFTVSRVVADSIAKKIGPIKFITISSLVSSIILVLWILGINPYLFVILGFTFGPVFPVIHKFVNNHLDPHERGLYNGLSYAGVGLTATLMISFMGKLGDHSMFIAYVPVLVISLILVFLIPRFTKIIRH